MILGVWLQPLLHPGYIGWDEIVLGAMAAILFLFILLAGDQSKKKRPSQVVKRGQVPKKRPVVKEEDGEEGAARK